MNSPLRTKTPQQQVEDLLDRIRRAAYELEHAADEAVSAADVVREAVTGDLDEKAVERNLRQLAEQVVAMHNDGHNGHARWCTYEACRTAFEVVS